MIVLAAEVFRDELISLLNESAEECKKGETQAEFSLLLEAHFLLGELIQNQLSTTDCAPPLSPPNGAFAAEVERGWFPSYS
jgi:hypothetical protein